MSFPKPPQPIVRRSAAGFTLIELLVVIAILGILSSTVMVAINPAKRIAAARDSQRKSDLAQIRTALEQYATQHAGKYPSNGAGSPLCGAGAPGSNYIYMSSGDNYKLIAHCTPQTALNDGTATPTTPYCDTSVWPYVFTNSTDPTKKVKPMVDPQRYSYSYAVYSEGEGAACW